MEKLRKADKGNNLENPVKERIFDVCNKILKHFPNNAWAFMILERAKKYVEILEEESQDSLKTNPAQVEKNSKNKKKIPITPMQILDRLEKLLKDLEDEKSEGNLEGNLERNPPQNSDQNQPNEQDFKEKLLETFAASNLSGFNKLINKSGIPGLLKEMWGGYKEYYCGVPATGVDILKNELSKPEGILLAGQHLPGDIIAVLIELQKVMLKTGSRKKVYVIAGDYLDKGFEELIKKFDAIPIIPQVLKSGKSKGDMDGRIKNLQERFGILTLNASPKREDFRKVLQSLEIARQKLEEGAIVIIYPTGSSNKREVKSGVARLAAKGRNSNGFKTIPFSYNLKSGKNGKKLGLEFKDVLEPPAENTVEYLTKLEQKIR